MSQPHRLHRWLRYGEGPIPALSRRVRRRRARQQAEAEYGSVEGFLETVRAESAALPLPRPGEKRNANAPADIVHLSTYPVHPRRAGGQIRTFHMAKALADRHEALNSTILSVTNRSELAGHHRLDTNLDEICVYLPESYQEREAAIRLVTDDVAITDIALSILWRHVEALSAELVRHLPTARLVVAAQPFLVTAHRDLAGGVALIYDAHNDESELKASILPDNQAGTWLLERTREVEAYAASAASMVTATTHEDMATLRSRAEIAKGVVVPNGVDTDTIEFSSGSHRLVRRLELTKRFGFEGSSALALFVGSSHQPNLDAAHLIVDIAAELPDVTFLMVGEHSDRLTHKVPGNVVRAGQVDQSTLELALGGADVALNPVLSGGGSNMKLLSYLAAGLPVVSTKTGARGIDHRTAGVHIVSAADLASGIMDLIGEHSVERSLRGRSYVESERDWTALSSTFANLVATEVRL